MNKEELIKQIASTSGVGQNECEKVLKALEVVLSDELESSKGITCFFDKIYKLMSVLKKSRD